MGAGGPGLKDAYAYGPGEGGGVNAASLEGFDGDVTIFVGDGEEITEDFVYWFGEGTSVTDGNEVIEASGGFANYSSVYWMYYFSALTDFNYEHQASLQFNDQTSPSSMSDPFSLLESSGDIWWLGMGDDSLNGFLEETNVHALSYLGALGGSPFLSALGDDQFLFRNVDTEEDFQEIFRDFVPTTSFDLDSTNRQVAGWSAFETNENEVSKTTIRNSGYMVDPLEVTIAEAIFESTDGSSVTTSNITFNNVLKPRSEITGFHGGNGLVPSQAFGENFHLFSNLHTCFGGGGNSFLGTNTTCGAAADGGIWGNTIDEVWGFGQKTPENYIPGRANSGAGAIGTYVAVGAEIPVLNAPNSGADFYPGEDGVVILRFPAIQIAPYSAPAPFSGPIATDLGADDSQEVYITGRGQQVKIVGDRLADVTAVEIDGVEIDVDSAANSEITFTAPADFTPGEYAVSMIFSGGSVLIQERILFTGSGGNIPTGVCTESPKVWTKRISETQAKMYIKCPDVDVKYSATHQQDGGEYVEFFGKTLAEETDSSQFFNGTDRYFVRTIDLATKSRIKIYENGELKWQVVYNEGSFTG